MKDKKYLIKILGSKKTLDFIEHVNEITSNSYIERKLTLNEKCILGTLIHNIYFTDIGNDDYMTFFGENKNLHGKIITTKCLNQSFTVGYTDRIDVLYAALFLHLDEMVKSLKHPNQLCNIMPVCIFVESLIYSNNSTFDNQATTSLSLDVNEKPIIDESSNPILQPNGNISFIPIQNLSNLHFCPIEPNEIRSSTPIAPGIKEIKSLSDLYPDDFKQMIEHIRFSEHFHVKTLVLNFCIQDERNKEHNPIYITVLIFYVVVNTRLWSLYKISGHVNPLKLSLPLENEELAFEVFTALFHHFVKMVYDILINIIEFKQYDEIHDWLKEFLIDPNLDKTRFPFPTYYRFGDKKEKGRVIYPKIQINLTGITLLAKNLMNTRLRNLGSILEDLEFGKIPLKETLEADEIINNDPWINLCVLVSCEMEPFFNKFREKQFEIHQRNIDTSNDEVNYIPDAMDSSKKTNFLPEYKFPTDFINGICNYFDTVYKALS